MLVFDLVNARATIVGPTLVIGRAIGIERGLSPGVVLHWPESVILQGILRAPGFVGLPLHRVSFTGSTATVLQSMSIDSAARRVGHEWEENLRTAPAAGGRVWSANSYTYRIAEWSSEGKLLALFDRHPSWFVVAPYEFTVVGNPTTPPPSATRGVSEDAAGNVWALLNVAAPGWKSAWVGIPSDVRELPAGQLDPGKLFRSVVEVLDPKTGRMVVHADVPGRLFTALPGARTVEYEADGLGVSHVVVIQLELVRR
jgi:hypothetical protein